MLHKSEVKKYELWKSRYQKDALKVTIWWKSQVDQINIFTFMDELLIDVTEKMWILDSYSCKEWFIKVMKMVWALQFAKVLFLVLYSCKKWFIKVMKMVWALQKLLSEGCIKSDHLLKNSGWSDQYLHFYGWFSGWCDGENLNFGLV